MDPPRGLRARREDSGVVGMSAARRYEQSCLEGTRLGQHRNEVEKDILYLTNTRK